jgi:DNA-binding CsgD family transcriptional regulator
MATGPDTLSDKEKDALRLLLRGHDAKSSARELGLSVHTVNERLREARRKLGVTSSREAARRLLEAEGEAPEMLGDKRLGEARQAAAQHTADTATGRWAGKRRALTLAGVLAMSLIIAALFLPASPLSLTAPAPAVTLAASAEGEADAAAAAQAAEAFLTLIDQSRWAESYAATGAQFRALNTLERWTQVSETVRPPLGKLLTRNLVANEFVPAPPEGYQLVKFASTYGNGTSQVESVSLEWEDGAWRVVGIVIG